MGKVWLLLHVLVLCLVGIMTFTSVTESDDQAEEENMTVMAQEPLEMKVTLEKSYMDGKIEKETVTETISSMPDFWSTYEGWEVMEQKEGHIRFRKEMDDISPFMKTYGYFGIKDGVLTIFEGVPINETVIQSFYHIDTEELESHLYENLKDGIKIKTKENYQQVLETFRSYQNTEAVNS
ncbi:BofC C-terminal domain-containing protein [Gracilibacillus sp. YIM 98692]|uniref:BofC C-terminal domain-containing protein n=1 Tax=Gracilibacillus sp. YIM 98692 TaxID=2663532 RepID=UPI0013CF73B3|nr:BofC C-terminal domain-containing protein [Gracilibacillus sp. YIM 98692]